MKKAFSSTAWETSDFGGFSRMLWDLPEMRMPYGFNIKVQKKEYLSVYSEQKLLGLFLYKANTYGFTEELIKNSTFTRESKSNMYGGSWEISKYEFNKNDVKKVLTSIIAKEVELKSLFINFSNLLSNSEISYEISRGDFEKYTSLEEIEENKNKFLKESISKIKEQKSFSFYSSSRNTISSIKELKEAAKFVVFDKSEYSADIHYTKDETFASSKLLEALDISFEEGESKITNLRCGKLDVMKLAESTAGNVNIYYKEELYEKTKPFSVCILCDESGSMNGTRFDKQHEIVKILYKTFSSILPSSKLYVYGHTGDMTPEIHVYQDRYNPYFEKTFSLQFSEHVTLEQNYDGPVTDLIYEKIRSYTNDNILFIVISDGEPAGHDYGCTDDYNDFKRIIEKCKRDGFVTCGIGIEYMAVKDIYQYSTVIKRDDDYIKSISTLINNVVKAEFQ